ncbi:hypothetical protein HJ588_02400 [Flexivirga sp. ID2601S]|uniref:Uncharacterized protein n=1 Tax=Flexivirga aerilata TaxID=1656889 RepID=A0A849AEA0_9MICO|nr:hypothetical protein [Flexivirga aerilata]NNG38123.1 hypothetical protein [Flexivirga aerilata]
MVTPGHHESTDPTADRNRAAAEIDTDHDVDILPGAAQDEGPMPPLHDSVFHPPKVGDGLDEEQLEADLRDE